MNRLSPDNGAIQEASHMLSQMSQDPNERELYEARRKAFLDYNSNIEGAREEGKAEGNLEGKLNLLLVLADSYFNPLPEWAAKKLGSCTDKQITKLSTSIFKSKSVKEWLEALDK